MSNDLINRKALLRELGKWDISKLYLVDSFKELVKEQRSACDIETVVDELKIESFETEEDDAVVYLEEAIEIVRSNWKWVNLD